MSPLSKPSWEGAVLREQPWSVQRASEETGNRQRHQAICSAFQVTPREVFARGALTCPSQGTPGFHPGFG
jgi:hypothetical protein